jgi:membrane-bound serine protease (ClpP class)
MNPFILLAIGLLLIFIEFYLPGAVMGIAGGIFVFASIIVFAFRTNSPLEIILFIIGTIAALSLLIRFALWRIRTAKPDYSIYSDGAQVGYVASGFDKTAVGKTGTVLSDLKPGGYVLIEGKQQQALSVSGYITKGSEVIVIGGQEESLLVKQKVNKI